MNWEKIYLNVWIPGRIFFVFLSLPCNKKRLRNQWFWHQRVKCDIPLNSQLSWLLYFLNICFQQFTNLKHKRVRFKIPAWEALPPQTLGTRGWETVYSPYHFFNFYDRPGLLGSKDVHSKCKRTHKTNVNITTLTLIVIFLSW